LLFPLALNFDYGDNTSNTIVASIGKPSSASENGIEPVEKKPVLGPA
jgi:hypothetical protein